jgi:hypothetical protein
MKDEQIRKAQQQARIKNIADAKLAQDLKAAEQVKLEFEAKKKALENKIAEQKRQQAEKDKIKLNEDKLKLEKEKLRLLKLEKDKLDKQLKASSDLPPSFFEIGTVEQRAAKKGITVKHQLWLDAKEMTQLFKSDENIDAEFFAKRAYEQELLDLKMAKEANPKPISTPIPAETPEEFDERRKKALEPVEASRLAIVNHTKQYQTRLDADEKLIKQYNKRQNTADIDIGYIQTLKSEPELYKPYFKEKALLDKRLEISRAKVEKLRKKAKKTKTQKDKEAHATSLREKKKIKFDIKNLAQTFIDKLSDKVDKADRLNKSLEPRVIDAKSFKDNFDIQSKRLKIILEEEIQKFTLKGFIL